MTPNVMIHEMPVLTKTLLCQLLDEEDNWKKLAVKMGYVDTETAKHHSLLVSQMMCHKNGSRSELLLDNWAEYYHSCTELFVLLYQINNYAAMELLRPLVASDYHKLILKTEASEKILNCPLDEMVSNEENASDSSPIIVPNQDKNAERHTSGPPNITYAELTVATNNWSKENLLGKGGFASVYKGNWNCTDLAIKRIEKLERPDGTKIHIVQIKNELNFLSSCPHDNVLALYGYSMQEGEYPCLVYKLMKGGTLENRLSKKSKKPPLTWNQRLVIAHGTAKGLQYLHNYKEKPLIHGDIKPANILLDLSLQPIIGDFGLAREGTESSVDKKQVSQVYGTRPYLPVDFITNRELSPKVDTYSFGVVLFELATGRRAHDENRKERFLKDHVTAAINAGTYKTMVDTSPPEIDLEIFDKFVQIGARCTRESDQRPEMRPVFENLDKLLASKEIIL